jgi:3-dehydroquinate dehydratase I
MTSQKVTKVIFCSKNIVLTRLDVDTDTSQSIVNPKMNRLPIRLSSQKPLVVGSYGNLQELSRAVLDEVSKNCDMVEIRLDMLVENGWNIIDKPWSNLTSLPLLFTARRKDEGGVINLSTSERTALLCSVIDDASFVDIELRSCDEMSDVISLFKNKNIPWVASYHDFEKTPAFCELNLLCEKAKKKNADIFKVAARVHSQEDVSVLELFQKNAVDIFVSTMGMGELGSESRVRCAMAGSVLNYGYLGSESTATAPGQRHARALREAIRLQLLS